MASASLEPFVDFDTDPSSYRHWRVETDGPIATVTLAVAADGGLRKDYDLKLNSYDLSVDIELDDIVQRLRFGHPEVGAVVLTGGLDKVFCAGANIQMLATASTVHKVNFCKFTNETRNSIEEATSQSRQVWIAAVNGTAAGGGYELALACDEIVLVDDRASAVSLPEVPLLAVLPGTGGLTRVVDKRCVRRDLADVFATRAEGIRGQQALDWGLVDAIAPRSRFDDVVKARASERAGAGDRPDGGAGMVLTRLTMQIKEDGLRCGPVEARYDRALGATFITLTGPEGSQPATPEELLAAGPGSWIVASARALERVVLHLRFNEPEMGTWVLCTEGSSAGVLGAEALMANHGGHWLVREVRLAWGRALSRLDLSARTLVAQIEPGSCFAGTLAELALAADRSFMLDGPWQAGDSRQQASAPELLLSSANDGWYPMVNGLSRLQARFYGHEADLEAARSAIGKPLGATDALEVGLITFAPDELDWDDDIRVFLEERRSFSPDALTGLEANYRFVGPETMQSKIFARLTAWQNWIFQRPNAVGPEGALQRFGTGARPNYDRRRT